MSERKLKRKKKRLERWMIRLIEMVIIPGLSIFGLVWYQEYNQVWTLLSFSNTQSIWYISVTTNPLTFYE